MRIIAAALALLLSALVPAAQPQPVPEDSVYQLRLDLLDQGGTPAGLDVYRGHPVLISMFYSHCPHVCPMLISSIQAMERDLTKEGKAAVRVLLVSLDPERDTPARLAEIAQRHGADLSRWKLARADAGGVRKLAAVLNIQYRQLPDGEFNHATLISLLGPDGRVVTYTAKLGLPEPAFVQRLQRVVAAQ